MPDFSFATTRRDGHREEGQRDGVGKKVKEGQRDGVGKRHHALVAYDPRGTVQTLPGMYDGGGIK